MNRLTAIIALATLAAFLGILAYQVPSPDLIIVILITGALVVYDFITSSGSSKK